MSTSRTRRWRWTSALVALSSVALAAPALPAAAAASQAIPVPVTGPDAALAKLLDPIVALAPEDTCLVVSVDGTVAYDHRGSDPQIPASTQKLFTTSTVLARLGANGTLATTVTAPDPHAGLVAGDLALVGGGDPVLVTDRYRAFRHIGADQASTSLDALADQLVASGVRTVTGGIVVDDSRYDDARSVDSWPHRYLDQNQVGPLGALVVDDGYRLETDEDGEVQRVRAEDPAIAAGEALRDLLADRGIVVHGGVVHGVPVAGATTLATVASPTIGALVHHLLLRSDNQVAELLLKELGRATAGDASTAAGAQAVTTWATAAGAFSPGNRVVDGSGLDPTNATTCADLVKVLDASGPDGPIAADLPVAGRSGTLAARFRGTAAEGTLRAKTGSLGQVSALAGFASLPEGGTATFSFVANGKIAAATRRAEALLGIALATWKPTCPTDVPGAIDAPLIAVSLELSQVSGLGGAVAAPGLAMAIDAASDAATAPVDRCSYEAAVPVALDR